MTSSETNEATLVVEEKPVVVEVPKQQERSVASVRYEALARIDRCLEILRDLKGPDPLDDESDKKPTLQELVEQAKEDS